MDNAKNLMTELDKIDEEIIENESILKENNISMTEPLVDDEGYPLGNIDVYSVRHARNKIICLQNDRKNKLAELEQALAEAHDHTNKTNGDSPQAFTSTSETVVHRTSNDPIAKVDKVWKDSPAEKAELKDADLIIQFGPLHAGNFGGLNQLKEIVMNSINKPIKVTILRGIKVYRLEIIPKSWSGNGVLGCSFLPIGK